jgi:hypothetical protein
MENKQTAVEWIEDELSKLNSAVVNTEITPEEYHTQRVGLWEKAKQMEKEQIIKAYANGVVNEISIYSTITGEEYYKETYANDTTKGLPEEDSKRRAWHY